jgi:hypothetical protein
MGTTEIYRNIISVASSAKASQGPLGVTRMVSKLETMNFRLVEIEKLRKVETKKLGDSHEWELLKFIEIYNFGGFFVVKG